MTTGTKTVPKATSKVTTNHRRGVEGEEAISSEGREVNGAQGFSAVLPPEVPQGIDTTR
ncbi:MAG: hypothetical protein U0411_14905 [Thermodesulfovibrionales bacterium]